MAKDVILSIIFPVLNQADHINRVINYYHKSLSKLDIRFELIAVVNGSSDNSFEICNNLAKKIDNLRVYEIKEKGYGLGIIYGLDKASGKYLCYLNSARVYEDELIKCVRIFLTKPEILLQAVRVKRDVYYRRLSSVIYNFFCCLIFGIRSSDINGSPKIFSRENYHLLNLKFTDSMIDLEILEKANKYGLKVLEVPIYKNKRHGGISTSNYNTILRLIREVIRYFTITRLSKE